VVAVVGVIPFFRDPTGCFQRGEYRNFRRTELSELHALLLSFDGLILGQNLFNFDYRVLRPHISLQGIVEKTLDLYFFLDSIDSQKRARLSLEVLAQCNLRTRKLSINSDIPALWRAGRIRQVLRRNERDCDLVAELWMKLIRDRYLKSKLRLLGMSENARTPVYLQVNEPQLPVLYGHRPFLTHDEWMRRLTQWNNVRRDPKTGGKTFVEEDVDSSDLLLFHRLRCDRCFRNFVLRAGRSRIYKPRAAKGCPFCQRKVSLAKGATLMKCGSGPLRFVHLRHADDLSETELPSESDAREFIRGLRFWSF